MIYSTSKRDINRVIDTNQTSPFRDAALRKFCPLRSVLATYSFSYISRRNTPITSLLLGTQIIFFWALTPLKRRKKRLIININRAGGHRTFRQRSTLSATRIKVSYGTPGFTIQPTMTDKHSQSGLEHIER